MLVATSSEQIYDSVAQAPHPVSPARPRRRWLSSVALPPVLNRSDGLLTNMHNTHRNRRA